MIFSRFSCLPFLLIFMSHFSLMSQSAIDSLVHLAATSPSDTQRILWLTNASDLALDANQDSLALKLVRPLQKEVESMDWDRGLAEVYFFMGYGYYRIKNFDSARFFMTLADSLYLGMDRKDKLIQTGNVFATIALYSGDYDLAVKEYVKVLAQAEEAKDTSFIAGIKTNIGWVSYRGEMYAQARSYTLEAQQIYQQIGSHSGVAQTNQNLAAIYADLGSMDTSLSYMLAALESWKAQGNDFKLAWGYSNLGGVYNYMEDYEKADEAFLKAIELFKDVDDPHGHATVLFNFAKNLIDRKSYRSALPYVQKAREIAEATDYYDVYANAIDNLALAQFHLGEYKQAYINRSFHQRLEDSVRGADIQDRIANIQAQYETEKKERVIAEQERDLALQQADLKEKRTQNVMLVAALITLVLGGGLFYTRYRSIQGQKLQQAVITEQEKGLEAVFLATEEERKRIAKDLHDGVGQQLSALKMGFQQLKDQIMDTDTQQSFTYLGTLIDETAQDTRTISHQMMPRALTELGLVPAIEDSLYKTLGTARIDFDFEHFNLQERYEERKEIAIYRILQELVNNVIKHSEAKHVSVQLYQGGSQLHLVVEDDGRGVRQGKSDGHGWLNIKNRLSTFKGKFQMSSEIEGGTVATISIPIA
ncbi:MAG: sensor histidine kinase [Bacteroidota bacterium]